MGRGERSTYITTNMCSPPTSWNKTGICCTDIHIQQSKNGSYLWNMHSYSLQVYEYYVKNHACFVGPSQKSPSLRAPRKFRPKSCGFMTIVHWRIRGQTVLQGRCREARRKKGGGNLQLANKLDLTVLRCWPLVDAQHITPIVSYRKRGYLWVSPYAPWPKVCHCMEYSRAVKKRAVYFLSIIIRDTMKWSAFSQEIFL